MTFLVNTIDFTLKAMAVSFFIVVTTFRWEVTIMFDVDFPSGYYWDSEERVRTALLQHYDKFYCHPFSSLL